MTSNQKARKLLIGRPLLLRYIGHKQRERVDYPIKIAYDVHWTLIPMFGLVLLGLNMRITEWLSSRKFQQKSQDGTLNGALRENGHSASAAALLAEEESREASSDVEPVHGQSVPGSIPTGRARATDYSDSGRFEPRSGQQNGSITAIKFLQGHDRGMDILLRHGRVKVFPGPVYVSHTEQIQRALPRLQEAGVVFEINQHVASVKVADARSLATHEGWRRPDRESEPTDRHDLP